jgi:hypothetical protein
MPLLAFKPVGRSSLDMSGRSTGRDAWNCAVKRSLGAWMKLEVILGCVMGRAEQRERNNDIEVSSTAPNGGVYMVQSLFHSITA